MTNLEIKIIKEFRPMYLKDFLERIKDLTNDDIMRTAKVNIKFTPDPSRICIEDNEYYGDIVIYDVKLEGNGLTIFCK